MNILESIYNIFIFLLSRYSLWQRSTIHELRSCLSQDVQEAEEGQDVSQAVSAGMLLSAWHSVASQEVHTSRRMSLITGEQATLSPTHSHRRCFREAPPQKNKLQGI